MVNRGFGVKGTASVGLLTGLVLLAGCSIGDTERPTSSIFVDSPRPADSQAYPNLSRVPPRPEGLPSPEERARIREQLEQDRNRLNEATAR